MMTPEELHYMGIKVAYKELVDKGYEVLNVRKETDVNPQILARKDDRYILVVVKTACYPHMGILEPEVAAEVAKLAIKHQALCYFASVGIANAKGETEEEMARPVTGGEYYINYDGMQPLPIG
ncbi:MAG: hypothetical protein JXR39_03425 [Marinilabiliaceae bacterium]|nr:hypothetical protein [Marinilabiliaceae bacterium]